MELQYCVECRQICLDRRVATAALPEGDVERRKGDRRTRPIIHTPLGWVSLGRLIETCRECLVCSLSRQGMSRDESEDMVQEAAVACWKHLTRHAPLSLDSPVGWLYKIAFNLMYRERRRSRQLGPLCLLESDQPVPPSEEVEREDEAAWLRNIVESLPDKLRGPVICVYFDGLTRAQAAAALGLTEAAIHSLLYRVRQLLCDMIREDSEPDE